MNIMRNKMENKIKIPENKRGLDPVVSSAILNTVNNLPFYVMLIDADHHILLANNAVKEHLGVDLEHIIGGYCPRVIHGLNGPFPGCPLEEVVEKGHAVEREIFDNKSGRWIMSAIYPTESRTLNDQVVYFHMVQDITEKKQAEDEIQQNLHNLRKAIEGSIELTALMVEAKDPYTAGHH